MNLKKNRCFVIGDLSWPFLEMEMGENNDIKKKKERIENQPMNLGGLDK